MSSMGWVVEILVGLSYRLVRTLYAFRMLKTKFTLKIDAQPAFATSVD